MRDLCFYFGAVGVLPLHLSVHVLLELLHVKQLESPVQLQETMRQLQDLVADGRLLQDVLDVDVPLADPLHQDVAVVTHLQLASGAYLSFELLHLVISQGVVKTVDTDFETVKAVFGAVDREDGGPGVGLGNPPVPLEDDHLGPDLVLDVVPLLKDLGDVVLKEQDVKSSPRP